MSFPKAPLITELYAIYCEAFSVVRSGGQLAFPVGEVDVAKSLAKMLGASMGSSKNSSTAPAKLDEFTKFVRDHLDPDWRTREPYGPPR